MFEQRTELQGTPMGPKSPPNAKGTANIAPEIAVLGNPAFLVIFFVIWGKTGHFGHFGQPFPNQGGSPEKKSRLRSYSDRRDRAMSNFSRDRPHGKPHSTFYCRGFDLVLEIIK